MNTMFDNVSIKNKLKLRKMLLEKNEYYNDKFIHFDNDGYWSIEEYGNESLTTYKVSTLKQAELGHGSNYSTSGYKLDKVKVIIENLRQIERLLQNEQFKNEYIKIIKEEKI